MVDERSKYARELNFEKLLAGTLPSTQCWQLVVRTVSASRQNLQKSRLRTRTEIFEGRNTQKSLDRMKPGGGLFDHFFDYSGLSYYRMCLHASKADV